MASPSSQYTYVRIQPNIDVLTRSPGRSWVHLEPTLVTLPAQSVPNSFSSSRPSAPNTSRKPTAQAWVSTSISVGPSSVRYWSSMKHNDSREPRDATCSFRGGPGSHASCLVIGNMQETTSLLRPASKTRRPVMIFPSRTVYSSSGDASSNDERKTCTMHCWQIWMSEASWSRVREMTLLLLFSARITLSNPSLILVHGENC